MQVIETNQRHDFDTDLPQNQACAEYTQSDPPHVCYVTHSP